MPVGNVKTVTTSTGAGTPVSPPRVRSAMPIAAVLCLPPERQVTGRCETHQGDGTEWSYWKIGPPPLRSLTSRTVGAGYREVPNQEVYCASRNHHKSSDSAILPVLPASAAKAECPARRQTVHSPGVGFEGSAPGVEARIEAMGINVRENFTITRRWDQQKPGPPTWEVARVAGEQLRGRPGSRSDHISGPYQT